MRLLLSMPGGSEWLIIILFLLIFVIVIPILAIVYYARAKQLKRDLENLSDERNDLLKRLLDKTS